MNNDTYTVNRRTARKVVLKALYARELSGDDASHILRTVIKDNFKSGKQPELKKFCESLFLRTIKNIEELDEILSRHSQNWDLNRLAIIDKLILRMALTEFLYFEDIPVKVTINEALEIAKLYSTKKSSSFINGLLDSALDSLQKDNLIVKTGRGLVQS